MLLGVRHHSPACARRVRQAIAELRPAFVLIEGPSDFNPHIEELRRPHRLPVAIFSYHAEAEAMRASYAPFCDYSPEWQALGAAWASGAKPLFCDLPAWHPAFGERENRYADPHRLREGCDARIAALAARLGAEGQDALWDTLAEQAEDAALPAILDRYFALLRPEDAEDPAEAAREAFMAGYAGWALREAGGRPVVLVCGGWHVGGIRRLVAAADGALPAAPVPAPEARTGSYLVPYGYARLDRFAGYAAGMPSPGYYDQVHAAGLAAAADWAMTHVADALRGKGQPVSTADRIAWRLHAEGLARLRGHRAILRADLLDAAMATLVKDGLEGPAAWSEAPGRARDPLLDAMLAALSGDREGGLAPGTRQPPLVADVEQRLAEAGLLPGRQKRRVRLDWEEPREREQSQLLHQLLILRIPGIERAGGPAAADSGRLIESFDIALHRDWTGALIEASGWGGTLPMAAAARLAARVAARPGELAAMAEGLSDALFAGLLGPGQALAQQLEAAIPACHDVAPLGQLGRRVVRLHRFGEVFGTAAAAALGRMGEAVFARALWLLDGTFGNEDVVPAVLACRDLARDCPALALDLEAARALMRRCIADDARPPMLAGAALGYLIACAEEGAAEAAAARIRRFGLPDRLGDFLAGLFALAREELRRHAAALAAIDALVAGWTEADFLRALPAMRFAFAWFPPAEREALAMAILRQRGMASVAAEAEALAWMRQGIAIEEQAAALALEARVAARLARHGMMPMGSDDAEG